MGCVCIHGVSHFIHEDFSKKTEFIHHVFVNVCSMITIMHLICNLSLQENLVLKGILDGEGILGDSEEVLYLFAINGYLMVRSDGVVDRYAQRAKEKCDVKAGNTKDDTLYNGKYYYGVCANDLVRFLYLNVCHRPV